MTMPIQKPGRSRQDYEDLKEIIPEHPFYYVAKDGRVFSGRSGWGVRKRPLELAQHPDQDGYMKVDFVVRGRHYRRRVHVLVAKAFISPSVWSIEVRHLDGNKLNNNLSNLAWGTQQDNADDRARHGRTAKGERGGNARLSNADAAQIKSRLSRGELQKSLAKEFGVHKTTIQAIASNRNWKWLQVQQ